MKKMRGLVIGLFLMMFPTIAYAELKDILSHFQAYITVEEEYNSNINLTPTNRKDDFITRVYPGIKFSTAPKSPVTGEFERTLTAEKNYRGKL